MDINKILKNIPEEEKVEFVESNIGALFLADNGIITDEFRDETLGQLEPYQLEDVLSEIEVEQEVNNSMNIQSDHSGWKTIGEIDIPDNSIAIISLKSAVVGIGKDNIYSASHRDRVIYKDKGEIKLGRASWISYDWKPFSHYAVLKLVKDKIEVQINGRRGYKMDWKVDYNIKISK